MILEQFTRRVLKIIRPSVQLLSPSICHSVDNFLTSVSMTTDEVCSLVNCSVVFTLCIMVYGSVPYVRITLKKMVNDTLKMSVLGQSKASMHSETFICYFQYSMHYNTYMFINEQFNHMAAAIGFFLEMQFWGGELLLWGEKNVKSVVPSNS